MSRRRVRTAQQVGLAAAGVAALVAMSAAPGAAATTIAQASATAVQLTIGGQTMDTGSYQAVNDGSKESTSGSNMPAVTALGGQTLLTTGTLAQDAKTTVTDGKGSSVACSSLAGPGATAVGAGTPGSCLTGGQAISLNAGTLDLKSLLNVSQAVQAGGVDLTPVVVGVAPITDAAAQITNSLQTALTTAVTQSGLGVSVNLGALQSSCTAGPNSASGTANIAGGLGSIEVAGQTIPLNLPANPPPNTHVVANLGTVVSTIQTALIAQLTAALRTGVLSPAGVVTPILDQAKTAILANATNQIAAQLAPLQDNVIDATLNRQTQASPDQITVTALDLKLLPVVQQQAGINAFELSVATSNCGPSGKVEVAAPSATPTQQASTKAKPKPKPSRQVKAVPTAIPAGLDSATATDGDAGHGVGGVLALGGLLAVAVGGAGAAWSGARKPR